MTDGFGEHTWHGDFDVPLTGGRIVADDPRNFTVTMRWLVMDHVRVHLLVANGAHRWDAADTGGLRVETGEPPIVTIAFAEGALEYVFSDHATVMQPGDVAIGDEAVAEGFRAPGPTRLLWSVIGRQHIQDHLFTGTDFPAFLPRTKLVNSYIAFLSALMTHQRTLTHESPDIHLARAIVDLQLAVLAERRGLVSAGDNRLVGLRGQIEQHIMEHLPNRDLTPASIADSLGISLRYAHQVFNQGGETIAAYIRDRRLDAVAKELTRRGESLPITSLAAQYGFASRDNLTRAFRRRFGATTGDYREQQLGEFDRVSAG